MIFVLVKTACNLARFAIVLTESARRLSGPNYISCLIFVNLCPSFKVFWTIFRIPTTAALH